MVFVWDHGLKDMSEVLAFGLFGERNVYSVGVHYEMSLCRPDSVVRDLSWTCGLTAGPEVVRDLSRSPLLRSLEGYGTWS